jgi:hypothetical protein
MTEPPALSPSPIFKTDSKAVPEPGQDERTLPVTPLSPAAAIRPRFPGDTLFRSKGAVKDARGYGCLTFANSSRSPGSTVSAALKRDET